MDLAIEYQQCAYLTSRYDEAESWIEKMLARPDQAGEGRDPVDADTPVRDHRQDGGVDRRRDHGPVAARHAHHGQSGPPRSRAGESRGQAQPGRADGSPT